MTIPVGHPQIQLSPLSTEGLLALQRNTDEISREITEEYFAMHPEFYQGNTDRIRKICKEDSQHHLRFLSSAMVTITPEIFTDYTCWLKDVLLSRNMPVQHLIDSYTLLKSAIIRRLPRNDQAVAINVMDAGIAAVRDNSTFAAPDILDSHKVHSSSSDYTQALVSGSRLNADRIIKQNLAQGLGLIDLEVGVIQPAMYQIGRLWQQNKITVAQEHMATALVQNTLARAFASAEFADPVARKVVCACVEGNHHGLGLRMVSDAYEVSGWDVSFLGTDTPNSSILTQVDMEKPDVLALSVSLPHQVLGLQQLAQQLRAEMGSTMPALIVGGLAFNHHQQLSSRLKVDEWYLDAKSLLQDIT